MITSKLSDCFKINFFHLKFFGIWPGQSWKGYYKYYMAIFIFVNFIIYNSLLILNLVFTPRKIEYMIREVIFLFTEVAVTGKVLMIMFKRKKILSVFDILNCEVFKGEDDISRRIVESHVSKYKTYWSLYAILSNFAYSSQVFVPIIVYFIFNTNIKLPICKYYFLDEEYVRRYFVFLYLYQSLGIYGHMQYNVNIDALISGLLILAIAQVKVLKYELKNIKPDSPLKDKRETERSQIFKLHKHLKHYEELLNYCSGIQDIVGLSMFVQFGIASIIICVVLSGLRFTASVEALMFMVTYLFTMILQIYVPAWLGTQLNYESQELVFAAYSSQWIRRSEKFKRSLKLFMERANTNIVLTGWRIFPLSLDTFTSIMNAAYSFFTLLENMQSNET
nr:odorant receptor 30a-like [Danaus plexippus plexippus]